MARAAARITRSKSSTWVGEVAGSHAAAACSRASRTKPDATARAVTPPSPICVQSVHSTALLSSDARPEVGTEGAELHQLVQVDAQELELVSGVHCLPGDSGGAVGGVGGALEEDQQLGHTLLSS